MSVNDSCPGGQHTFDVGVVDVSVNSAVSDVYECLRCGRDFVVRINASPSRSLESRDRSRGAVKISVGALKKLVSEVAKTSRLRETSDKDDGELLFDFADGLTHSKVEDRFPGALDRWNRDEEGNSFGDDEDSRTLISVTNGKLYSEPDTPQTPWVWDPEKLEWHQIDEPGYEEYD